MRISDWSSDVCSSDLGRGRKFPLVAVVPLFILRCNRRGKALWLEENQMTTDDPLWSPSEAQQQEMPLYEFMTWCAGRHGGTFPDTDAFHTWSIAEPEAFWSSVWTFCCMEGERSEEHTSGIQSL